MTIDPKYLQMSFDKVGIRNSQKRLKELIDELAITPLKQFQGELTGKYTIVEEIVCKRIAMVFAHWCQNKHDPVVPASDDLMSDITNSRRNDVTVEQFYSDQVTSAMYTLAPIFHFDMPEHYEPLTDELEYALLELEEKVEHRGGSRSRSASYSPEPSRESYQPEIEPEPESEPEPALQAEAAQSFSSVARQFRRENRRQSQSEQEQRIVITDPNAIQESNSKELSTLRMTSEEAWRMIYGLMGYPSEYVQSKLLPRWQQYPESFEKDRRFLYEMFIKTIQNSAGVQVVAGNFSFADGQMSIDQLWNYYFADLSQKVGPQLAVARIDNAVNETTTQKWWRVFLTNIKNISPIWLLALAIALLFDGLTTYVSLDQTPMDGFMVWVFTILITALFQIADLLVINYRKREFEAEAMSAKYAAKFKQLTQMISDLDTSSESYVQFSMDRSRAHADWKAAEDNRKMARRGRFWSARIADINIIVTAYGFAFMFLNSQEPMRALYEQIEKIFVLQSWETVNIWVFLMIGMAITVSFVINTAQRTEILGWTMRRLKNEA